MTSLTYDDQKGILNIEGIQLTKAEVVEFITSYDEEKRAPFYQMARKLITNSLEMEGYLLLLSTWNFASFRYAINQFDIDRFSESMRKFEDAVEPISKESFASCDLKAVAPYVEKGYNALQEYKVDNNGKPQPVIGATGAPKLMHLKYPNMFVLWDGYIRGNKPAYYYNSVDDILKATNWKAMHYGDTGKGYIKFLEDTRDYFDSVISSYKDDGKPVTKAIDEFNYVAITKPLQEYEKEKKKRNE